MGSNNFKRAVRERMEKFGESYSTARMHVLRERASEKKPESKPKDGDS